MYEIQQITEDAQQKQRFILPDSSIVQIQMEYKPLQYGWFITSLTYGAFELRGIRICVSPNLLHQWINKLPFGLCVKTKDNFEPSNQTDFVSGYAKMYFLSQEETAYYRSYLSGEV